MTDQEPIDLGEIGPPEPEKLVEPWVFRAACMLKAPSALSGVLQFGLILDLGFGIYRQINAILEGAVVPTENEKLVESFASNWAANGHPNPLEVITLSPTLARSVPHLPETEELRWFVQLYRVELELETLKALGRTSLVDALAEQGLIHTQGVGSA